MIAETRYDSSPGPNRTPQLHLSEIISALSYALDLTEGQPLGHSVRSCVIGMRLAQEIGMDAPQQRDLYYALLLKDAGCSSNSSKMAHLLGSDDIRAKRDVKVTDWTRLSFESLQYALAHVCPGSPFLDRVRAVFEIASNQKRTAKELVKMRCERGSAIARRIGFSEDTADAIQSLDELWNGQGQPMGLRGEEIPLLSRIMNLAQTAEIFHAQYGVTAALNIVSKRSHRWFDPNLVRAFRSIAKHSSFWEDVFDAKAQVLLLAPSDSPIAANDEALDRICLAFADVIDAKSPFTYRHSAGVAGAAVAIARTLSVDESQIKVIRRAALLHDIGKLSVSNTILDKPSKLTNDEWGVVKKHPYYTLEILKRIPGFAELSDLAASHHEKLDGTGYFRNKKGEDLSLSARILVVADIFDALSAKRPYRDALPLETVFEIMRRDAPNAIDGSCLEALLASTSDAFATTQDLIQLSINTQEEKAECLSETTSSIACFR